jgi:hypothetical protein
MESRSNRAVWFLAAWVGRCTVEAGSQFGAHLGQRYSLSVAIHNNSESDARLALAAPRVSRSDSPHYVASGPVTLPNRQVVGSTPTVGSIPTGFAR